MSACEWKEFASAYALDGLPESEALDFEAHLTGCAECRTELGDLGAVVRSLSGWPTNVLRPSPSLGARLARRISDETGRAPAKTPRVAEPEWERVAPGIWCKLLANDTAHDRVSMLVRLEPGVSYPAHTHEGVEELHLLDGELWIDDRKLLPGDYNKAEPGTSDRRVWSETGCTCVLITSPRDTLR